MASTSNSHECRTVPQYQDMPRRGYRRIRVPRVRAPSSSTSQRILVARSGNRTELVLHAAYTSNLRDLRELVKQWKETNVTTLKDLLGRGALHFAATGGHTAMCKYLIMQLNADPNVKDNQGFTPLDAAAIFDHGETFRYLLKHGAQVNVATESKLTTLHHVAARGWKDVMNTLIAKGADVNAESLHGTPLQHATHFGIKIAVWTLLDKKADPNIVVPQLYTPLMQAIWADSVDCVKFLLKAGADPNMDALGDTPLTLATDYEQIDIIKQLLKAGANANATNFFDLTAIEIAAANGGDNELMALLLDATAPIPSITDWSYHGIMMSVNDNEEVYQRERKFEEKYLEAKAKGAKAFERGDFIDAIAYYTMAMRVEEKDIETLANLSKCWACLNQGENALWDALDCIELRKGWPTAYLRAGVAWKILGNYDLAADEFKKGLELDPENKELRDAYQDVGGDVTELAGRIQSLNANE